MKSQAIKIGDVLLDKKILSKPIKIEEEKIKEIDKLIKSLGGPAGSNALKSERLPLKLLCCQRAQYTYPELNISFLSEHNILNYKCQGNELWAPKCSVY